MKTNMEDLTEFFNSSSELKKLNQKDLPDEEFAEIIRNNFNENEFRDNLFDYIINRFEERFNFKEIEDNFSKIIKFEISSEDKNFIMLLLKYFIVAKTLSLQLKEKSGSKILNQISTSKEFQEDANLRINHLKDDLLKKYEPYNEYINSKFSEFFNSFNKDLNEMKLTSFALNDLTMFGINIINSQLPQPGRPHDLIFNTFLLKINEISDDICPEEKYSKLIKPFFIFIAQNYPNFIDINDVNDTKKLRQRVIYLKSQSIPPVE